MRNLFKNASARLRAVQSMLRVRRAYRIFDTPEGRMVLGDLFNAAGMLSPATVEGDPYLTHFNDGKRALALHILERLRWSEMELLRLAQERADDSDGLELGENAA